MKDLSQQLRSSGWSQSAHLSDADLFGRILEKRERYFQIACDAVKKRSGTDARIFDKNALEVIEAAKSVVRVLMRYDNDVVQLGNKVYADLRLQYADASSLRYSTLPYVIIHLPDDLSEKGPMHRDGFDYIDRFITTWTPLNDCHHDAIAVNEGSHLSRGFIGRFTRERVYKTAIPHPRAKEYLLWYGNTQHEGLLNTSGQTTSAVVFRFTDTPILYEATIAISELNRVQFPGTDPIAFTEEFLDVLNCDMLKDPSFPEMKNGVERFFPEMKENIHRLITDPFKRRMIAFGLTLWAQRMEVTRDVSLIHLFAFLAGGDNLYSYQKFARNARERAKQGVMRDILYYGLRERPFRQTGFLASQLIHEHNREGGNIFIPIMNDLPVMKWNYQL